MNTFPCYAFEYTSGSRMCVHTNVTSLVINGGFLGLKDNPAVDYYERSKASYANLFQSRDHAALKQQNTYFAIKLNKTLEECAYACMGSTVQTCLSFSHSPNTGACGLSNVFYGDGHEEISLLQSQIYNHYQYYTSWPCNVTIPENYGPRVLASLHFPYQSIRHAHCHMIIEAPSGKQVQILFPTVFFGQDVCNGQNRAGLTVHDGISGTGSVLGHYCHSTSDRSHPPLLTSTSGSLYVTYTADDVSMAFESIYQFVTVDPCESSQCKNSATCIAKNTSYVCECPAGFAGQFCEVNVDECASSPCLFHGQCVDQVNGYSCNCTHEFTGDRCEKFIGACADNPCDHGACVITSRYNYTCTCIDGYVGKHCNMKLTPCMSNPCQQGTCGETTDDYICKCIVGYTGRNCDRLAVDLCTFSPCKHGRCTSTTNLDVLCTCDSGFTGKYCETSIDLCAEVNCHNGSCVRNNTGYTCQCNAEFKGKFCDVAMTACELHVNDCNPGRCYSYVNVPEGYVCLCPDNKYRQQCNMTYDPCSQSPCHHGTCSQSQAGYTCACANGYIGSLCNIPTCTVADCGLGLCEDKYTGYNCICPVGYGGKNCENSITIAPTVVNQSTTASCMTSSCHNNATCIQENLGFKCVCSEGWTGSACDEIIDACASDPCINSTCVIEGSKHKGGTCMDSYTGIVCICPSGFHGARCDVTYDACATQSCPTGLCQLHETGLRKALRMKAHVLT
ncbi:Neurogenic locus notch-like protein 1 [Mizuhopecten yessoensis]|uniref:Neurogenic locus notch-like protein 1 n=1 Tax=Mizuhopecten yessoensis TaxID=6573 RepID=A0A210PJ38_MIZYE|nr:Neurogenic locus notch-like protein 1 [Mizuhopecten yessoensis]